MTVDSGAADNVIPHRMVKGEFNRIRSSKGSMAGVHYVSASSARIPNEGECDFHFQTKDGQKENYTFQIAEVNKTLISVLKLIAAGNEVILEETNPRIVNKKTGETTSIRKQNGIFVIDLYILKPKTSGFTRPGQ